MSIRKKLKLSGLKSEKCMKNSHIYFQQEINGGYHFFLLKLLCTFQAAIMYSLISSRVQLMESYSWCNAKARNTVAWLHARHLTKTVEDSPPSPGAPPTAIGPFISWTIELIVRHSMIMCLFAIMATYHNFHMLKFCW